MNEFIKYDFESDINIYPVFDVHYGCLNHYEREFRDYLNVIKNDPNGYVCLGGDLINMNIGGRVIPWEDSMSPQQQKRDMIEMLEPLKDRILCSVRGNHEFRATRSSYIDVSADIMSKLNLESRYRPDIAYLSIGIGKRSHGKRGVLAAHRFIVAVTHGFGGGLKPGSSLNRADDYWGSYEGIDVGITGHVHRPTHAYKQKLVIDRRRGTLSTRTDLLVLASSWLDGSTEGYAVRKGYPAVPTCIVQRITLHAPVRTDMPGDIEFSSRSIHSAHWD